jgi:AraC family transcriptional regulator
MNDNNQHRSEYISRINRTFDYIESHLHEPITLEELASIANFSKYHFSRVFQSIVGESPFQFILRIRIEKAATLLLSQHRDRIRDIAYRCGFSDISVFSRYFKKHHQVSATQFRNLKYRNISQQVSNTCQPDPRPRPYFCPELQTIKWISNMEMCKSIEVRDMPKMTVAYLRHIGPYKGNENLFGDLWNRLFTWAGPRGLIGGKDFKSLIVYHDDPNITIEDKLRMSVCITVAPDTKVDGEIGKMELEAARYAVARFEVGPQEFQQAWDWVYGYWLPGSGYQPDDKPCFEAYPEEPRDGKFIVDICVPVRPI